MKKLSLSILALLFAATTFAAPPGWVEGVASKDVSAAVAADPSAIHREGRLEVDHGTLQQLLYPWPGDNITLDFDLPGELVDCGETPVGWECGVDGSTWRAGVADLDGVKGIGKLAGALDDFTAPGAQSYVRIPIAEVPASGEWRIDKQLGGDWADFTYNLQPALTAQEIANGASRPAWAVNSIAIYHASKRNDINSPRGPPRNYMTGKAAHLPAPVAVGFRSNLTTITGWTYGAWEIDTGTGLLTKVFDAAVIQGWSNTATVVADATLGFTSIGVSKIGGTGTEHIWGSVGTMPENGTVSQHSYYNNHLTRSSTVFTGLYLEDSTFPTDPGALVTDSQTAEHSIVVSQWNDFIPDTTTHAVSQDDELWMFISFSIDAADALGIAYDLVGDGVNLGKFTNSGQNLNDTMPDPFSSQGFVGVSPINNAKLSIYITYTAGGGGGGATPPGPLNLGLGLSL